MAVAVVVVVVVVRIAVTVFGRQLPTVTANRIMKLKNEAVRQLQ